QVRRVIAFVVDDLGLSFESTYYAREALKKFVNTQMQDGDLVAIIRTGRGLGALQQFTNDKRILLAAIEKLVWNPQSRNMMPRFGSVDNGGDPDNQGDDRIEDFRETVFTVGTLGALNFVVRGMHELPGRKLAVLVSDGFPLFKKNGDNELVLQRLRRLVDLANRSSVVIYSLDAEGLLTLAPSAADNMGGIRGQQMAEQLSRASQSLFDSQEGLAFLARETGGLAFFNSNDLNLGLQKALHDNQSYYLLGFDPDDAQFNGRFHSIKVRLKRSGLAVRTRSGFFGVPEAEAKARKPQTRDQQILGALFSPFGARDVQLQMTSFFLNTPQGGSFVRSLMHIEPAGLTFKDGASGEKTATFEIAAFTFDEKGAVVEASGRAFTLAMDEARYRRAVAKGFDYQHDLVLKKPGAYQFRAVIRDAETGRLGSAGQFIQVPDLTNNRLTLSGLFLIRGEQGGEAKQPASQAANQPSQSPAQGEDEGDVQPTPAVRRFSSRSVIEYDAVIYNATPDKTTGRPQLTAQTEVYRDGKPIYQAPARPVEVSGDDFKHIPVGGQLKLSGLAPGDYVLHLIVNDALASPKYRRVEQWMDFSVR